MNAAGDAPAEVATGAGLVPAAALRVGIGSTWAWWATLLGVCGTLVAPLFLVDVPPLGDYPNHLARAFVLASLPSDRVLAAFYAPRWAIIPNLGTDLIVPALMRALPLHDAGRLLIAAAVLLPVLGAIAYGRAVGRTWWCLAAGLVGYSGPLMEGFLNFNLSIGLALLLAAAWLRWRESNPVVSIVLNAAGAIAVFTCHLMGLVLLAVLLPSAECCVIVRAARDRRGRALDNHGGWIVAMTRLGLWRAAILLTVFAVPLALYSASSLKALGGDMEFLSPGAKLAQLLAPFVNYAVGLDIVTAVAIVSLPVVSLMLGKGRIAGPAILAMCGILIAYLTAPYAWKGTYQLDTRFAVMLSLMLFASFQPVRWPPWLGRIAAVAAVSLFIVRMALLTTAWAQYRADLYAVRQALAPVLPGQAVYVASVRPSDPQTYESQAPRSRRLSNKVQADAHIGALALIERRAWWPFEFDIPSQQPMMTKEPYGSLAERIGSLPNQDDLLKADLCGFNVVLLTQADAAPQLPEPRFHILVQAGYAALYSIETCKAGA